MNFYLKKELLEYLDISIIMIIPKELGHFIHSISFNNSYFQRNGIEVILMICFPEQEKALLEVLENHPRINWKVIMVKQAPGEWNYSTVTNTGIFEAYNQYILVVNPMTVFPKDSIYQMRYLLEHYPMSFATNLCSNPTPDLHNPGRGPSFTGSNLMMKKQAWELLGGYNEEIPIQECATSEIKLRLELAGWKEISLVQEEPVQKNNTTESEVTAFNLQKTLIHSRIKLVNSIGDIRSSYRIIFDWRKDKFVKYGYHFLESFENYSLLAPDYFSRHYSLIALISVKNETKHIPEVLLHLDAYCDGIILLDDGSDDETYEQAYSDKLLLKVKKRKNDYFNDLENRNVLLQLGHLFKCDWFYFTDADERFDDRFDSTFSVLRQSKYDVALLFLVHLWDNKNNYRTDLPEGINGIFSRYRLFRNKGFLQFMKTPTLHFPSVPYRTPAFHANIMVKHFGLIDEGMRKRKYDTYTQQDKDGEMQGFGYNYLLSKEPETALIQDLESATMNIRKISHK